MATLGTNQSLLLEATKQLAMTKKTDRPVLLHCWFCGKYLGEVKPLGEIICKFCGGVLKFPDRSIKND